MSNNEQRDELARDIFIADNSSHPDAASEWDAFSDIGGVCGSTYAYDIADGLIAAGYRKPRTITTAEELDALPEGSVVSDSYSDVHEKIGRKWFQISDPDPFEPEWLGFPATVIYEPTTEATK